MEKNNFFKNNSSDQRRPNGNLNWGHNNRTFQKYSSNETTREKIILPLSIEGMSEQPKVELFILKKEDKYDAQQGTKQIDVAREIENRKRKKKKQESTTLVKWQKEDKDASI